MLKWYSLSVAVVVMIAVSTPAHADQFRYGRLVAEAAPAPKPAAEVAPPAPPAVQAQPEAAVPAPEVPGGSLGKYAPVYGYPFVSGCCGAAPSCCDNVWAGYCGPRRCGWGGLRAKGCGVAVDPCAPCGPKCGTPRFQGRWAVGSFGLKGGCATYGGCGQKGGCGTCGVTCGDPCGNACGAPCGGNCCFGTRGPDMFQWLRSRCHRGAACGFESFGFESGCNSCGTVTGKGGAVIESTPMAPTPAVDATPAAPTGGNSARGSFLRERTTWLPVGIGF